MNKIYGIESLKEVTNQIINWNYEPIKGVGIYTKIERYAHIEISLDTTEYYTDQIIWNVKEEFIPCEFRQEISDVLAFFGNYTTALKGMRKKNLLFEITDGSFNNDSGRHAFTYATIRSLVSCFDKKIFEVRPKQLDRIDFAKKNGLDIIKHWAKHFSEEKIIESLKDVTLTSYIKEKLDIEKLSKLKTTIQLSEAQNIVGMEFLNQNTFVEKNVVTKYGDLSQIGFAHIALIVNNKAALPYIGIFSLDLIKDKFI